MRDGSFASLGSIDKSGMEDVAWSSSSSNITCSHHWEVQPWELQPVEWLPMRLLCIWPPSFWMVTSWCQNWAKLPLGYMPCLKIDLKTCNLKVENWKTCKKLISLKLKDLKLKRRFVKFLLISPLNYEVNQVVIYFLLIIYGWSVCYYSN